MDEATNPTPDHDEDRRARLRALAGEWLASGGRILDEAEAFVELE